MTISKVEAYRTSAGRILPTMRAAMAAEIIDLLSVSGDVIFLPVAGRIIDKFDAIKEVIESVRD